MLTRSKSAIKATRKSRKAMLAEVADFLLWTRQYTGAFVVFNKEDLKSLRKPH